MEKLKMHSVDNVACNVEKISRIFPNCVVERKNDAGEVEKCIDFEMLKQELSGEIVEGIEERYQFIWPDKKKSVLEANMPITKTLRPARDESVNFNNTKNLYIEGDNVEILKLLQETYLGKINLIYIDPPYNAGEDILYINDYSIKIDEFNEKYEIDENGNWKYTNTDSNGRYHTDWCNMIYQRIKLSKNLLAENGFFLVSIDHHELFNLGQICDEVFGYTNRIGIISVVHKPEGRNQAKFIGPSNEFLLMYAKNESISHLQKVALDEEQIETFSCQDDNGAYKPKEFIRKADGKYATRESKPEHWYPIYVSKDLKKLSGEPFDDAIAVYPITETGVERTWKTIKSSFEERYKNGDIYAEKEGKRIVIYEKLREDQVIKTHWIAKKYHGYHFGTKLLDELLGVKTFDFPKSLYLMHDIIKLFCPKDALILDFFSGSGTTAHATMLVNCEDQGHRKYIMAQIPASCDKKSDAYKGGFKTICEIGKERIRRAGAKIKADNPLTTQDLDTGFRVLKCDSSNMEDVYYTPADYMNKDLDLFADNVKPDRSSEDLLFQVMLELGALPSSKIEKRIIAGKEVFDVAEGFLMACFDKDVTEETITEIAKLKPTYFVLRDASLANDSVAVNFEQIFATYSPNTERRVL